MAWIPETRWRVSRKLAPALVLLILAAAVGQAAVTSEVVTGHVNYVDMEGLDPCLAAIAGITRLRVMWFDDSILHERAGGEGGFVYAIEAGAPAPVNKVLFVNRTYHFQDPNGIWWTVTEAYFDHNYSGPSPDADPNAQVDSVGTEEMEYEANVTVTNEYRTDRYFTWIVKIGNATYDRHAGTHFHDYYNFVTMVNTCKFNDWVQNGTTHHSGNDTGYGHLPSDGAHDHQTYEVDLYVDGAPTLVPLFVETPNRDSTNTTVDADRMTGHEP